MSAYHNCFDLSIQCEEFITVTPEEQEEIFALIAQENEANQGFLHWLKSLEETERVAFLEQHAFEQATEQTYTVHSSQGAILIKRDGSHPETGKDTVYQEIRDGGITL